MVTGSAMDSSEECIDYQDSRFTWLPDLTELEIRRITKANVPNMWGSERRHQISVLYLKRDLYTISKTFVTAAIWGYRLSTCSIERKRLKNHYNMTDTWGSLMNTDFLIASHVTLWRTLLVSANTTCSFESRCTCRGVRLARLRALTLNRIILPSILLLSS